MHVSVVKSTARTNNRSQHAARAVFNAFDAHEAVDAQFVDVKDHVTTAATMPDWGADGLTEPLTKWKEIAESTDAFVFVLPEYNRGYPGEWKLLVDSIMKPFSRKPVALVGVSAGIFGGARVLDHVKPVLIELGFRVESTVLHFPKVKELFDEDGALTDDAQQERIDTFVEQFITDITHTS